MLDTKKSTTRHCIRGLGGGSPFSLPEMYQAYGDDIDVFAYDRNNRTPCSARAERSRAHSLP